MVCLHTRDEKYFAPRISGYIFAISNTIANVSGFLAPQLTGHLLDVSNSLEQWQLAFWDQYNKTYSVALDSLEIFSCLIVGT